MKTALYRFLIRWHQASDQPLPAWLERACHRDASLARVHDNEQRLTSRFRTDARPASLESSPFLKPKVLRIMSADTRTPSRPPLRWIGSVAALACVLALGVWVSVSWLSTPGDPTPSSQPQLATTEDPPAPASASLPPVATLPSVVRDASWANPLDREMERVLADALGAVRFVASSFLPSEPPAETPSPSSG